MKLLKNVIIAYTDICAVSSRSMLGLIGGSKETNVSELTDLCGEMRPACVEEDADTEPVSVIHCTTNHVSVVIFNTILDDSCVPPVLNKLMDLCADNKVDRLVIPAVLRVELTNQVYEYPFHGQAHFKVNPFPEDVTIKDQFLLTLMSLVQVEGIPGSCLVVPGYRARPATPNPDDGSLPSIRLLHSAISRIMGVEFDSGKSQRLVYRGKNEPDDDAVSIMYS